VCVCVCVRACVCVCVCVCVCELLTSEPLSSRYHLSSLILTHYLPLTRLLSKNDCSAESEEQHDPNAEVW
jgi:hypothetical protein